MANVKLNVKFISGALSLGLQKLGQHEMVFTALLKYRRYRAPSLSKLARSDDDSKNSLHIIANFMIKQKSALR
jgi:hypothetical protein